MALAFGWRSGGAAPSDEGDEQALQADPDYTAASAAMKNADFARALPLLLSALKRHPESANLRNDLGYSYRKLGQLEPAFEQYRRALAIDPRHRAAHEYIGEAYLMVGDLPSAEKHLQALRSICILSCEELRELQEAIEAYRRKSAAR
jgi:Flp pilus assembly protein TadD